MDEEFLQFIWKFRLLENNLRTTDGQQLEIIKPGDQNSDSGPDFFNAMIDLGGTKWAGNVECHLKASDWFKHGHHTDASYDNIILHVVYTYDECILREDGTPLTTVEVSHYIRHRAMDIYRHWLRNRQGIPCSQMIGSIERIYFSDWLASLMIERMERKVEIIRKVWSTSGMDFNQLFNLYLFRSFGQKINMVPFELLFKSIPANVLSVARNDRLVTEALMYGQAGMLNDKYPDTYPILLKKQYACLREEHQLIPVDKHIWHFLRLRPPAFPTIRISQLAGLVNKYKFPVDVLLAQRNMDELMEILSEDASPYWENHYMFGKRTNRHPVRLGDDTIRSIILNLVIPFLVMRDDKDPGKSYTYIQKMLEDLDPENNSIIRYYKSLGFRPENAADSQAMIELRTQYCNYKRCLDCRIGYRLLKRFS